MKRFTGTKGTIILLVLIIAMVGYYYYLGNKSSQKNQEDTALSKVQTVLLKDLKLNYPPTPKELVKYYSELTMCFYDPKTSKADLESLALKAYELFDEELKENNPWAEYLADLEKEVGEYNEKKMVISSYSPAGSTSVDIFTDAGREWARFYCEYFIKVGSESKSVEEVFLLRKDENGLWKIYGWDTADNVNLETQENVVTE